MMRFGITALEFSNVAKEVLQGGVANLSNFDVSMHVDKALELEHISVIELSLDVNHIIPNAYDEQAIKKLQDLKESRNISYTIHLPMWSIELTTFNEPVRKGSVKSIVESIKATEPLEPDCYVLHSTGALATEFSKLTYPPHIVSMINTMMSMFSASSIEEILAQTEIDPRKLAVENLDFPFEVTRDVIDEYDTGICFDTGHQISKQSGEEPVLAFYRKHRDRIVEFHLHDGSATRTHIGAGYIDHRPLGTQEMPVRELLTELIRDKFSGPIIFELTADETRQSLDYIKKVVPEVLDT